MIELTIVVLCLYLVNAIISVSLLRTVFAVLPTLAAAHNSNWFTLLPVLGFSPIFVINRNVAVKSQCPTHKKGKMKLLVKKVISFKADTL